MQPAPSTKPQNVQWTHKWRCRAAGISETCQQCRNRLDHPTSNATTLGNLPEFEKLVAAGIQCDELVFSQLFPSTSLRPRIIQTLPPRRWLDVRRVYGRHFRQPSSSRQVPSHCARNTCGSPPRYAQNVDQIRMAVGRGSPIPRAKRSTRG
jgi:hypothetical protein